MANPFDWQCPHCKQHQSVVAGKVQHDTIKIDIKPLKEVEDEYGARTCGFTVTSIGCANTKCQRVTITFYFGTSETSPSSHEIFINNRIVYERVYPKSVTKQPSSAVPSHLRQDYVEAQLISNLSPKASATLARRCLQGMIRDFCQIKKRTLYDEIMELERLAETDDLPKGVQHETIEAMLHLKDIGNIAAHMTVAGDVIVDVDADEAEQILGLIEMLFDDWYVARESRQAKLAAIKAIAENKKNPPTADAGLSDVLIKGPST